MSLLTTLFEQEPNPPSPKEAWIAIRRDFAEGSGTQLDPYNGSTQDSLDTLLGDPLKITDNMTIHFGPGIFQTRGFGAFVTGFTVLTGQRFVGSGMHQTTLQIVKGVPDPLPGRRDGVGVFGTELNVSDVEISDMTLDCNLSRQANFPVIGVNPYLGSFLLSFRG